MLLVNTLQKNMSIFIKKISLSFLFGAIVIVVVSNL